jgi:hypothetical protein
MKGTQGKPRIFFEEDVLKTTFAVLGDKRAAIYSGSLQV